MQSNFLSKKQEMEKSKKEADKKFRIFMDSLTDQFSFWDSELNLITINKTALKHIPKEIRDEGLIGKNLRDFDSSVRIPRLYDEYLNVIRTGVPLFFEDVISDSMLGDIHLAVKAFKVGNGMGIIVTDITDYKRAKAELEKTQALLSSAIEQTPVGIMIADATPDVNIWMVNSAMEEIHGVSAETLIKTYKDKNRPYKIFLSDGTELSDEEKFLMRAIFQGKTIDTTEMRIKRADGKDQWILASASPVLNNKGEIIAGILLALNISDRKRVEQALQESEENYRDLMKNISDVVIELDSKGRFIYVSPQLPSLSGRQPKEIIGKSIYQDRFDFIHPDDVEIPMKAMHEAVKGKQVNCEYRIIHKDGYYVPVAISGKLIPINNDFKLVGVLRDITEQKKAEKALKESEEKYRSFVENFQGIAFKGYEDYSLDFFHGNVEEITGFTEEDFVSGKVKFKELIHPEDSQRITIDVTDFHLSSNDSTQREYRIIDKNGDVHWLLADIKKIQDERKRSVYGTIQDITGRKKIEEALKKSEQKYKTLITTMTEGICVIDLTKSIILVNPALEKMLGYSEDEMLNHPLEEFLDPSSIFVFEKKVSERFLGKVLIDEYELKFVRKNGTKITTRIAAHAFEEGSNIIGAFAVITDITTKRELEERRSSFMSMTAHELRTPTTIIRGYTELLESFLNDIGLEQSDKFLFPLQKINKNVQRLERLISDVKDTMMIERGGFQLRYENIILNDLLDEFIGSYKVILKEQLEYSTAFNEVLIKIKGDPVRLLQVLSNLMQNAIENTPKNTRKISINSRIISNEVLIEISDNGAGIEPQNLDRIFELFVSIPTEYTVQGTGVGLFLSRFITEAHGGTLTAFSKGRGLGSTFRLRLPCLLPSKSDLK
ncbi:MAG: PAS domain S-box protein [Promethearchaeota archaeon]